MSRIYFCGCGVVLVPLDATPGFIEAIGKLFALWALVTSLSFVAVFAYDSWSLGRTVNIDWKLFVDEQGAPVKRGWAPKDR